MAFNSTALKTTLAAPILVVAFATNAQTKLPVIEPSATDLSKPVAAACVETTPGQPNLTAWDKLKTIMGARGQMIAGSGDKIAQGNKRLEIILTLSNNFSGREGYIVDSSVPKAERENAKSFCFQPVDRIAYVDTSKTDQVPSPVNKGELGKALTNAHKAGYKVAVMGMYTQGSLFAIHFNPNSKDASNGAFLQSDIQGNKVMSVGTFSNFDYSSKMKAVMVEIAESAKREQAKTK